MSLLVGLLSTAVALGFGIVVGAIAGYCGGRIDDALMRFTEFFQTIPQLAMAVVLVAIIGPSVYSIMGAIALVSWPPAARLVRSEFMTLKQREFVQAAIVIGQAPARIVGTQILPNAMSPIIVSASFMVATAILTESSLSFLGLGDRNEMSWGFMIGAARTMIREAWWMSVWPGVAILLTVLAINLIGEGLNDALNPQLRARRSPAMKPQGMPAAAPATGDARCCPSATSASPCPPAATAPMRCATCPTTSAPARSCASSANPAPANP